MESSRPSTDQKRSAFRALHAAGTFVIPNPWDVGSARLLQHLGFSALASTSSGLSWSQGRPDYSLELRVLLDHLQRLCAAVDVPVSADFQAGFARDPEAVAHNVQRALETGVAGLSIEDAQLENPARLYDLELAVARVRAARAAITSAEANVVLVARTELLLHDGQALSQAIEKLVAFADAGADCLFAPGVHAKRDIATMVRAVAPKPLNVLMMKRPERVGASRAPVCGASESAARLPALPGPRCWKPPSRCRRLFRRLGERRFRRGAEHDLRVFPRRHERIARGCSPAARVFRRTDCESSSAAQDSRPCATSAPRRSLDVRAAARDVAFVAFGILSAGMGLKGFLLSRHFIDGVSPVSRCCWLSCSAGRSRSCYWSSTFHSWHSATASSAGGLPSGAPWP